jgi:hypothetical protein
MPRLPAATNALGLRIRIIVRFTRSCAWLTAAAPRFDDTHGIRCVARWGERDETDFRFANIDPGPAPDPGLAAAGIVMSRHPTILMEPAVPVIV